jgi:hypothetical protein
VFVYQALCSELKVDPSIYHGFLFTNNYLQSLYVAVTRARKQLWFMETQEHSVDPVLQALSQGDSLELAEVVRQDDLDVSDIR